MEVEPEGLTEKAGEALGVVDHRIKADLERFKAFIENIGAQTGGWRGHIVTPQPLVPQPRGVCGGFGGSDPQSHRRF